MKLLIVSIILISSIIGAVGALFLKLGSKHFHLKPSMEFIIQTLRNWRLIIGVMMYAISSIFFLYALRLDELSVVYPLTSMSYIFVTILSMWFLKEKINAWKIAGISLIILGVVFVRL